MLKLLVLFSITLAIFGFCFNSVSAESLDSNKAFGQFLDISQLSAEKYVLEYNKESFDIYYGFEGTVESSPSENKPEVESIVINEENKSVDVIFKSVPDDELFWIRLPTKIIEADNEKYVIEVNNVNVDYALTKRGDDYVVGISIPKDTNIVKIQGTRVIPEFGSVSMLILVIASICIVLKSDKLNVNFLNKN